MSYVEYTTTVKFVEVNHREDNKRAVSGQLQLVKYPEVLYNFSYYLRSKDEVPLIAEGQELTVKGSLYNGTLKIQHLIVGTLFYDLCTVIGTITSRGIEMSQVTGDNYDFTKYTWGMKVGYIKESKEGVFMNCETTLSTLATNLEKYVGIGKPVLCTGELSFYYSNKKEEWVSQLKVTDFAFIPTPKPDAPSASSPKSSAADDWF